MAEVNLPIFMLELVLLIEDVKVFSLLMQLKAETFLREYIPSVEKGFREAMRNGVLAGFPLESLKVVLD
ncbi:MAG: hypothetical protein MZV63_39565 [Marinilabiliales bacterium]|nr:hypothetical protein [Marinilabiliales bacterium]